MRKLKVRRFAIGAALFLFIVIIAWQFLVALPSGEPISEAEAKEIAKNRFNGKIIHFELKDDIYDMTIELPTGKYDIKIDYFSGDVLGISRDESETVQRLSKEEIERIIQKEQNGKIKNLEMRIDNQVVYYDAVVESSENKVFITLNGETGEIVNKKEEKKLPAKEEKKNITKEQAVEIALNTVHGEVDDVELDVVGGLPYYFVEIEINDKREANIQINAITGEVKSIEWDD